MNKNDKPRQFFGDQEFDKGKRFSEIPTARFLHQEKIPSGYDPMGEIDLRGRAYRNLASGRSPWWVLISAWLLFGGPVLLVVMIASPGMISDLKNVLLTHSGLDRLGKSFMVLLLTLLPLLVFVALPLYIVGRGTLAKLSSRKRRIRGR